MLSYSTLLSLAAFLAGTNAHGVILGAQGIAGSPLSVGFQVQPDLARNCTSISPCQQDATIIRDAEIDANIVNQCGRTELSGNIDVGENTENAIAAKAVTQVQAGTPLIMTIHQVNADGAGPYVCDIDETGNSGVISANLTVTNNVPGVNGFSQAKTQAFEVTVTMPDKLACTGGSTGDICTVRCRNTAVAGPFGGCVAVQQVGGTPKVNSVDNIATAQKKQPILDQIDQNIADLPAAIDANQKAGSADALKQQAAVASLLPNTIVSANFEAQTPTVVNNGAAADASTTAAAATATAKAGKAAKGAAKGNAAAGNAAAGNAATGKAAKGNAANAANKRSLRWAKRGDSSVA